MVSKWCKWISSIHRSQSAHCFVTNVCCCFVCPGTQPSAFFRFCETQPSARRKLRKEPDRRSPQARPKSPEHRSPCGTAPRSPQRPALGAGCTASGRSAPGAGRVRFSAFPRAEVRGFWSSQWVSSQARPSAPRLWVRHAATPLQHGGDGQDQAMGVIPKPSVQKNLA